MDARSRAAAALLLDFLERSENDEGDFEGDFDQELSDDLDDRSSDEEEQARPTFGGYEYEFIDNVLDNQICPVCLLPMRDAVQTKECGHRFCKDCLHGILRFVFSRMVRTFK
mgnify:CR=1 FL=1